jgi:hypothetical protein
MKSYTKELKKDVSNLIVDLQDIYYTLTNDVEMNWEDKCYFDDYVGNIRIHIRELDIELDLYKNGEGDDDEH